MNQIIPTDFLAASSTFVGGMAMAINIAGNFHDYNRMRTPVEADAYALASDWLMVGQDIRDSINSESQQR
jgi:hypothetical protein